MIGHPVGAVYTQSAGVLQCGDGIGKTHQNQC